MGKTRLKIQHGIGIALVGWYLMIPPVEHPRSQDVKHWVFPEVPIVDQCNPDADVSSWKQYEEFERLADCKTAQETVAERVKQGIANAEKAINDTFSDVPPDTKEEKRKNEEEILCAYYARCIASDDARLRK